MILSSINFVKANTKPKLDTDRKFTDFIIEKIKEDQDKRDSEIQRRVSIVPQKTEKNITDSTCLEEKKTDACEDTTVSIETRDGYFLGFHEMYRRISLSDAETPNRNCIFRQKRLRSPPKSDSTTEKILVAFHLNSDKSKYIAIGSDKRIEISANETDPDPEIPDNRVFILHEIDNGTVFIQPFHHKGCYFHHIDNKLTISKFELNYRPPEEFFFKINKIHTLQTEMSSASSLDSSITTEDVRYSLRNNTNQHPQQLNNQRSHDSHVFKKEHRSSKKQNKPSLFKGCFGLVSKQSKQEKRQKYAN